MTTTVATAISRLRDRLDEPLTSQWTPTQLRTWLNEGCKDIARRTFHYYDVQTLAVVNGTGDYVVNANVLRINSTYFQPTGFTQKFPLQPRQWEGMDQIWYDQQDRAGGYPVVFAVRGYSPQVTIKLFPVPTLNGTLFIHVARMPVDLDITGGTGNVDLPDIWLELAYDYAEYMAKRKDRDPSWKEAHDLYEGKIADMINNGDYLNAPDEVVWDGPYALDRWLVEPGY